MDFLFAGETCPQSWSLAVIAVLLPVYQADTCQWVYMPQYKQNINLGGYGKILFSFLGTILHSIFKIEMHYWTMN
jgi:hypothetical protein